MNHMVTLTDEEILLLDGKCQSKVQEVVDQIEARQTIETWLEAEPLTEKQRGAAAEAIRAIEAAGLCRVTLYRGHLCAGCDAKSSYPLYLSGRNKGQINYNKPIQSVTGFSLCGTRLCSKCASIIKAVVFRLVVQRDIKAEIPVGDTRYFQFTKQKCNLCGWTGHEGELGLLPALMHGHYRGQCPNCQGKSALFQNIFGWSIGLTSNSMLIQHLDSD